jgi:hypothetical protein
MTWNGLNASMSAWQRTATIAESISRWLGSSAEEHGLTGWNNIETFGGI